MINKLKHSVFPVLALLGLALTSWSPSAQAQSIGPPCFHTPQYWGYFIVYATGPASYAPTNLCASEATLSGINTYLQTGQAQSVPGRAMQAGGVSGGVVDQLAIANTQESSFRKQNQQALANEDVRDRALAVEEEITSSIYRGTTPLSSRACHSVATTGAAGGAAAGGGGSPQKYQRTKKDQEDAMLTPGSENDYLADLLNMPGAADSCTEVDRVNQFPGCTTVGTNPGLNNNPFILVRAFRRGQKSSFTIPDDKSNLLYQAQQGYISYTRPRQGPRIREASKNTPAGRAYLVLQRRYNSRALVVVNTLTQIASKTLAIDADSPFVENVWNAATIQGGKSLREDYQAIYAGAPVPEIPSEREIMNLLVLRQFTVDQSGKDLGSDPIDIARRRLDVKKVNALLLLKLNENAEWNNILYAHILSNRLDPVSREQMESSSAAVSN